MYGRLASAEKVECGSTLSFRRRKPSHTKSQLNSRPLTNVKLRDSGNPLLHDRTENAWTVSTSHCPIQSLCKALYGTTGGTYGTRIIRPVMLLMISGQRTRRSHLSFVIEASLFRNLFKAFLSLFIQTAYHLKLIFSFRQSFSPII